MREEVATTHATCPYCGLINYEDSKDIGGFTTVLVFFIGIPLAVMYGAEHLKKEFSIAIDEDYEWMLWVTAYGISLLLFCLLMKFRVSDLGKKMKEIEERS